MVAIDGAHCDLIYGLVRAFKPWRVLELGWGTGASCKAIYCGIKDNGIGDHTLVDNWFDGDQSTNAHTWVNRIITSDESEFVRTCTDTYDFILCDADHTATDKHWYRLFFEMLESPGILIFHDVTNPDFPNLSAITKSVKMFGLRHILFNRISTSDEHCGRGLLVVFK